MAWEPWLTTSPLSDEPDPVDLTDPKLLVNILTPQLTDEEREAARRWIATLVIDDPTTD